VLARADAITSAVPFSKGEGFVVGCRAVLPMAPFTVDVTELLREGDNSGRIQVTNTPYNATLNDTDGVSFLGGPGEAKTLRPAGLVGPVTLSAGAVDGVWRIGRDDCQP
jgi:hypothetical protein